MNHRLNQEESEEKDLFLMRKLRCLCMGRLIKHMLKLFHSHCPLAVRVCVCAAIMQQYAKGLLRYSDIYVRLTAALAKMNAAISGIPYHGRVVQKNYLFIHLSLISVINTVHMFRWWRCADRGDWRRQSFTRFIQKTPTFHRAAYRFSFLPHLNETKTANKSSNYVLDSLTFHKMTWT